MGIIVMFENRFTFVSEKIFNSTQKANFHSLQYILHLNSFDFQIEIFLIIQNLAAGNIFVIANISILV